MLSVIGLNCMEAAYNRTKPNKRLFMSEIRYMQTEAVDKGSLKVEVVTGRMRRPIEGAQIAISYSGDPDSRVEEVKADASGMSEELVLDAPPLEYSMEPSENQPFSQYTVKVTAPGYRPVSVSGVQIFSEQLALQQVQMSAEEESQSQVDNIVIPVNTLYGDFPPKIAESEIKPVTESGEIVLSKVVIPEFVIVHDGPPGDANAADYYVRYRDYIKNVTSSEIYSTWPDSTLRANILAIMSFTLNRVYTEWYRNQGYDFTITSSTAFDHKWIYGRNIFESISQVVDEIFDSFLSRPGVRQPILTQYCDGRKVLCPRWMTQWGSCSLGQQGYSPIEILRYYYGDSIYINTAEQIAGIPASWPGYDLTIGSSGDKVRQLQEQLDAIAQVYTAIPRIQTDGIYGQQTASAVREFQNIFGLPQTGVADFATWYKISHIYVGITRIAEL